MFSVLLTSVFFSVIYGCSGVNSGFRTAFTSKGLDYMCQVGVPILEQQLASISIPDVSGSASVDVIGKIDYSLSNIKLENLKIPTSTLKSGTSGLALQASGVSVSGSADWHYKQHSWPHISDSGSCDLTVKDTSLSVAVIIGKDANGHATLTTSSCSFSIGGLDVKFHGGASWLYNLFDDNIADAIKSSLNGQVCTQAEDAINAQGNKALETLPVITKVDDVSEIDYSLLQDPVFTTSYVESFHKGEFLSISNPQEAPFTPAPLPNVSSTDAMVYVWLTDYLVNSAGFVYQSAGKLTYTVTPDQVPSDFPVKLNTAYFKTLVPPLYNKYPNMDMEFFLDATRPPVLQMVPNSANITITGTMDVNVIQANKTVTTAFVLNVTMYADIRIYIFSNGTQQYVGGEATFIRIDLGLASSNIGQFSVSVLQDTVSTVVKMFIMPILNSVYLNKGIAIPVVEGLTFVKPALTLGQGYVAISTDINYKP